MSVSYIDQAGQVIATALAGESPNNVIALDSEVDGGESITADLTMAPDISLTANGLVARTENAILNTEVVRRIKWLRNTSIQKIRTVRQI